MSTPDPTAPTPLSRIFEYFVESLYAHVRFVRESGVLGPDPSMHLLRASLLEVGYAHLYLLDHELRRGRRDDETLNGFWREIAGWLAEPFLSAYEGRPFDTILGWRLGRYEDVARAIEEDETYGHRRSVRQGDYFYAVAQQLALSLAADAALADDGGLYFGIVDNEKLGFAFDQGFMDAVSTLKRSLLEHTLPLYYAAQLWSQEGPAYAKTIAQIDALFEKGTAEAEESHQEQREANRDLWSGLQWDRWRKRGACFRPGTGEDGGNAIEHGGIGEPYLRVAADAEGFPLGHMLLYAYDSGAGLVALADEERGLDAHLSVGRVQQMLMTDSSLHFGSDDPPDISRPETVLVQPATPWQLSAGARIFVWEVMNRLGRETPVAWITDADGIEALIVGSVAEEEVLRRLQFGVPPSVLLMGEPEPKLARFSLDERSDGETKETAADTLPEYPDADWRDRINNEEVLFHVMPVCLYGPVGEPYQVLEAVPAPTGDDFAAMAASAGAKPLQCYALGCYDLSYGIALRASSDGNAAAGPASYLWTITLGELIAFLRDGELQEPPAASTPEELARRMQPAEDAELTAIDRLMLPRRTTAGIAWAMQRVCAARPAAAAVRTQTGEWFFLFRAEGLGEWETHWLHGRVAWCLPPGSLARHVDASLGQYLDAFPLE